MQRVNFGGRRKKIGGFFWLPVLILVLASCSLGQETPTPVPVDLPVYQPSTALTSTVGIVTTTVAAEAPAQTNAQAAAPAPAAASADGLTYNGELVADQQVAVLAQVNGQVLELPVDVGANIKAGDVLVRIDSTTLEAQKAQALAGLDAAKAQLDALKDPPKESDLDAARAAVAAAAAAYKRATDGLTDEDRRLVTAQLKLAQAGVTVAQAGYNRVKDVPEVASLPQSLQLQQATLQLEAAQAQYDKAIKGPTADAIAGAYAQLVNARAALQRLQDGPKQAQIDAATAQVHAAETALYLAQLQLNKATITAPIDGVVSKVSTAVGAMAAPGTPVVTLLSHTVKITIPVQEARLSQVKVGQRTIIHLDAFPDRPFEGVVAIIAPELDPSTRTVQVTIRPTGDASGLAPGMSSTVELVVE